MGILFGLPNQLLLSAFGLALCVAIVMGYRLWWIKRPAQTQSSPLQTLTQSWLALALPARIVTLVVTAAFGLALPVMGASLLLFVVIDWMRWRGRVAQGLSRVAD